MINAIKKMSRVKVVQRSDCSSEHGGQGGPP